jgi:PQQ-like domain
VTVRLARHVGRGAAALGVAWSLAACGGGDGWGTSDPPPRPGSVPTARTPQAVPRAAPVAFGRRPVATVRGALPGNPLGDPANYRVTLGGHFAYVYDLAGDGDDVTAYDLGDGHVAWHEPYPADARGGAPAPVLAGASVLVGVFATATDRSDTTPAHHAVTAVGYDATTGYPLWVTAFDKGEGFLFDPVTQVVAANARYALVSVVGGAPKVPWATVLLDARTGRIVWTDKGFDGFDLDGSVVVGALPDGRVVGKSVVGDRRVWEEPPGVTARHWDLPPKTPAHEWSDAIPGLTLLTAAAGGDNRLVDAATGRTVLRLSGTSPATCVYDDRATAVCWGGGTGAVTAVDVPGRRVVWRRPDSAGFKVTTAWHGVVYGTEGGVAVTLDARTGHVVSRRAGVAPDLVNGAYGVVLTGDDLRAYAPERIPSTGTH